MAKKRKKKTIKPSETPSPNENEDARAEPEILGYSEVLPDGDKRVVLLGYDLDIKPSLPRGALRANPRAQTLGPWIKPRFYYLDQQRKCQRCQTQFTFSAQEQQAWYEEFGLSLEAVPRRCLPCRKIERFEIAVKDEHQAAIEAADASPKDADARLREAEARVRYFEQYKAGNLELAIAAARAAKKHHAGDSPLWGANLWEGWAQAQSGRKDLAEGLLQRFVDYATKKLLSSLAKEAEALKQYLNSGGEAALNQGLFHRTIELLGKKEDRAAAKAKLVVAEQRSLVGNALHGRASEAEMNALLKIQFPQESDAYKEWQAAANNVLVSKLATSDPIHLMSWAHKLVPHAKQHIYLPHNVACAFALAGAPDAAYEMCKVAIEQGYPYAYQLPVDGQLASIRARLETLVKERPGWRTKPALPPRYGYQVVTKRGSIEGHSVPELIEELAHYLRYTNQGTIGQLAFAYYPITRRGLPESVRKRGFRFLTLGEESDICLFNFGTVEPVVLLKGESEPRLLGNSLENFLFDWADAKTGLSQLDQVLTKANGHHQQLKRWLEFLGVKRKDAQVTVDLKNLFRSTNPG